MTKRFFKKKGIVENLFEQFHKSIIIAKKDISIYYNKGPVLIQGILFPIMLFFSFTAGRNIIPLYLISGLMAMTLFMTATSIGPVIFPWETRQKTLERLITCPVSIKTILLGNLWSSLIYGIFFSTIPLLIGIIFFGLSASMNLLIIIPTILIGAFSFSAFSLILSAPPSDTPSSTMTLTVLVKFPLIFISPLFAPIKMSTLALISPLSYFVDLINMGLGESSIFGELGMFIDFGFLILFGLTFLNIAFFLHNKTLQKRFKH